MELPTPDPSSAKLSEASVSGTSSVPSVAVVKPNDWSSLGRASLSTVNATFSVLVKVQVTVSPGSRLIVPVSPDTVDSVPSASESSPMSNR